MASDLGTSKRSSADMGQVVEELVVAGKSTRRGFERRWYDNNFFDDGYHFRYLSRQTNKIIDLSERANLYYPMRAIPKASRQIRGMTNLLVSPRFVPVVYPERVDKSLFTKNQDGYQAAYRLAKEVAIKRGYWLEDEWKNQEMLEKIVLMVILSLKHSVSFLKIWPDVQEEKICTAVRDAFDIYLMGSLNDVEDSPFVIEGVPRLLSEIKSDPMFKEEIRESLTADNRLASSDIKDAYERARYGLKSGNENVVTLIQKEAFIKERLNNENLQRIKEQKDGAKILEGKQVGDVVMRQVFSAGNITLKDGYVKMDKYPYVDFRIEPGPIYKTSQIERFIPSNKSLDMVVSRVERYTHTMVTGAWIKRQGEQTEFTNQAGGLVLEYAQTPPTQAVVSPLPAFIFNFINLLSSLIDEQGVSLTTMGRLPAGVKGHQAIESLKETEYSNLVVASDRLKQTIRRVSERMFEIADDNFVSPKEVMREDKGEADYFDVMGATAMQKRQEAKVETPDEIVPLSKKVRVDIQVESGLGFTKEGQKASAKELGDYLMQLAAAGYLPQEAVKVFVEKLLETYQFGSLKEFMEAMNSSEVIGGLSPKQVDAMKVAMIEVFGDLIKNGVLPSQEQRIEEQKVAMVEVIKDTGLKEQGGITAKPPSESIAFKDLPAEGKVQMAAQAGIQLSPEVVEAQETEEAAKTVIRDKGRQTGGGNNAA